MRRKIYIPSQRIDPAEYYRNKWYHTLGRVLGYTAAGIAFYALILFIGFNLLTKCGEVIYYPDGTWENGTCHPSWLFFTYEPQKGTWK